jgi:hypothetical protein
MMAAIVLMTGVYQSVNQLVWHLRAKSHHWLLRFYPRTIPQLDDGVDGTGGGVERRRGWDWGAAVVVFPLLLSGERWGGPGMSEALPASFGGSGRASCCDRSAAMTTVGPDPVRVESEVAAGALSCTGCG